MWDTIKHWLDWLAISVGAAVFAKWIPAIAGVFSIAWLGTQLYDYWFVKRKERKNGTVWHGHVDSEQGPGN